MAITLYCPGCGKRYRIKDELAGQRIRCKACAQVIRVPGLDQPPLESAAPEEPQFSESGSPIYRHTERKKEFQPVSGDAANIEAISDHIERHLGPVEQVYHEIVSDLVHIDVHLVAATEEKPYHTLITSGMSELPMAVPKGAESFRHAEVLLSLPPHWPLSQEAFEEEDAYWPIRWLKTLARLPHEYDTWLGYGHTVPHGDPPEPFAPSTKLCCSLLLSPMLVPDDFLELGLDEDRIIHFFGLFPLYREEMDFKLRHGVEPLVERLKKEGVSELLDPARPNVCKGKRWQL